jgi:hypothetical protein
LGWLSMSERDLQRTLMLAEVTHRRRTVVSAAAVLALSTRQVHRLLNAYRQGGGGALAHRAGGRPSNNRIRDEVRVRALELVRASYADFGPTLAAEMLALRHELKVSREIGARAPGAASDPSQSFTPARPSRTSPSCRAPRRGW